MRTVDLSNCSLFDEFGPTTTALARFAEIWQTSFGPAQAVELYGAASRVYIGVMDLKRYVLIRNRDNT
jgi:hypothetical protein